MSRAPPWRGSTTMPTKPNVHAVDPAPLLSCPRGPAAAADALADTLADTTLRCAPLPAASAADLVAHDLAPHRAFVVERSEGGIPLGL